MNEANKPAPAKPRSALSPRIVILDDEGTIRSFYEYFILKTWPDAKITAFEEGDAAWRELSRADPGLFITDINHLGMKCADMLARLSERKARYAILIISGHGSRFEEVRCNCDPSLDVSFIRKPIDCVEFQKVLEDALVVSGSAPQHSVVAPLTEWDDGKQARARSMKAKFLKVAAALAVLAALGWWGYHTIVKRSVEKEHEKQHAMKHAQMTAKIEAFSLRHNAITGWEETLRSAEWEMSSLELDDILANAAGRPILITTPIHDVARKGDKYFLYVHGPESTVRFVLECDQETARRVVKDSAGYSHFAIIARIFSVEKTDTRLKFQDEGGEDEAPVEVETSNVFFVRGHCLELLSTDEGQPTTPD